MSIEQEPDEDFDITETPDLDEFEANTEEDEVIDEGIEYATD